jgi:hypothetical protein
MRSPTRACTGGQVACLTGLGRPYFHPYLWYNSLHTHVCRGVLAFRKYVPYKLVQGAFWLSGKSYPHPPDDFCLLLPWWTYISNTRAMAYSTPHSHAPLTIFPLLLLPRWTYISNTRAMAYPTPNSHAPLAIFPLLLPLWTYISNTRAMAYSTPNSHAPLAIFPLLLPRWTYTGNARASVTPFHSHAH